MILNYSGNGGGRLVAACLLCAMSNPPDSENQGTPDNNRASTSAIFGALLSHAQIIPSRVVLPLRSALGGVIVIS